jgi:hypothetical protein
MTVSYEDGNGHTVCIKGGGFIHQLSDYGINQMRNRENYVMSNFVIYTLHLATIGSTKKGAEHWNVYRTRYKKKQTHILTKKLHARM